MSDSEPHVSTSPTVAWAILAITVLYAGMLALGIPQGWTKQVIDAQHHAEPEKHSPDAEAGTETEKTGPAEDAEHSETEHSEDSHAKLVPPPMWTVAPFCLLLLAIAVLPLIPRTEHWWESNKHRFYVAGGLGLVIIAYYTFLHRTPINSHWPAHSVVQAIGDGPQWQFGWTTFANAMLSEFIPFIVLLFSLYTISGGVRITGDLEANPMTNGLFIAIGGILASFIGTTGAAMLLIRPLLETNKERKHVKHTVVFFIFVVCNCGGCLLPIGDPPLFLGYLRGVPFLWTLELWREWVFVNGILIVVYLLLDQLVFLPKETAEDLRRDVTDRRKLSFEGILLNGLLLLGVIFAVGTLDTSKTFLGTNWHPWLYLREVVQLSLVGLSLFLGSKAVRKANQFNYHAIVEVAALFCGIFICMQPALQILDSKGKELGVNTPMEFFWVTGGLSSVLDNAPTYVVFFKTAEGAEEDMLAAGTYTKEQLVKPTRVFSPILTAISLGAVFMGAMTYIGNGPNFMVKAIAEKSGVKMPSFFGYMLYSVVFLLPVLMLMAWKFF